MKNLLWVVYKMPLRGNPDGINAVCEQSEWHAMELAKPGQYQLIQKDIASEGAAERLARGTSGDSVKRQSRETVTRLSNKPIPVDSSNCQHSVSCQNDQPTQ
jgi:hypothetical protein